MSDNLRCYCDILAALRKFCRTEPTGNHARHLKTLALFISGIVGSRKCQFGAVTARAHGCCEYCRSQEAYSPDVFSLEHIHPQSRGGATTLDNLALSCQGCNNHKAARIQALDPQTGELVLLFHPRQHDWNEHFSWGADYLQVVGQTPMGHATVLALQLNRTRLINLRGVMKHSGLHPP